jgi:4-carboxymuconolactone decarboxylase
MNHDEKMNLGRTIRGEVLGSDYVNKAGPNRTKFQQAFRDYTEEHCWAAVWTRPGLERKTRSMLNLAMLAVMARWAEFEVHVRGALNNGVSEDEIIEIVLQTGVYGGVPIAAEAMRTAERVINEVKAKASAKS